MIKQESAFPCRGMKKVGEVEVGYFGGDPIMQPFVGPGLTKLELISAMAMQGLLANPTMIRMDMDNCLLEYEGIESLAIEYAASLLEGLKKGESNAT